MSAPIEPAPPLLGDRSRRPRTHAAADRRLVVLTRHRGGVVRDPRRRRAAAGRPAARRDPGRCLGAVLDTRRHAPRGRTAARRRPRGVAVLVRRRAASTRSSIDENASTELTDRVPGRDRRLAGAASSRRSTTRCRREGWRRSSPTRRRGQQHIDTIIEFADDLDVDGIDLDYEQFAFADGRGTWAATRPNWVAFVTELADALHADDRTLTVSIPPVWGLPAEVIEAARGERGTRRTTVRRRRPSRSRQPRATGSTTTARSRKWSMRSGSWRTTTPSSEAGPIAPIWWVDDAVASTSAVVPEEYHDKLVLGVARTAANWVGVDRRASALPRPRGGPTCSPARCSDLAELVASGTPVFDAATPASGRSPTRSPSTTATTSCVQSRQVHWVDAEGAAARAEIARRAGLGRCRRCGRSATRTTRCGTRVVAASRDPLAAESARADAAHARAAKELRNAATARWSPMPDCRRCAATDLLSTLMVGARSCSPPADPRWPRRTPPDPPRRRRHRRHATPPPKRPPRVGHVDRRAPPPAAAPSRRMRPS